MPAVPAYVATTFQTSRFVVGGGYPDLTPLGVYITDQPTMDAVFLAANKAGVPLLTSATPFGTSSTSTRFTVRSVGDRDKMIARWETDRRNKQPLYAGGGTVAVASAIDGTLTQQAVWSVAGIANGASGRAAAADLANFPMDVGCPDAPHYVSNQAGIGYQFTAHVPDLTSVPATFLFPVTKYRYRTNSPKSQVLFWAFAGAPSNSYKIFIDGQPIAVRTTTPSYLDFLTFTFTDGLYHEIEVRTSALLGGVYWLPTYNVTRPDVPDNRLRIYTVGDSYSQPVIWNDTTAGGGADVEGLAQGIEDWLGGGDHYIDAIGGTGFIQRVSGSYYGPNNNYVDRLPSLQRAAPRIDLLLIPNGPANDVYNSQSQAAIVAAIRTYLLAFRALNSTATIVYGAGHTPPVGFGAAGPTYRAIMATLQASCADIGVYYVDNSAFITGTGHNTAKTGDGNADWIIGNDGVHGTGLGYRYLQARFAHKVRQALADDGSLINTTL